MVMKNGRRALGTELVQEYVDVGLERIQLLKQEMLRTRPIYETIYTPSGRDSVSKYPVEWLELRLRGIEEQQKKLKAEAQDIKNIISKNNH